MQKKYEILYDNFITSTKDTKVYRIKSLIDFSDVKAGDIGGYVENESNLSHDGNCWIYNDAVSAENGRVFDNAKIKGFAEVFENGKVYNDAIIDEDVSVFGNAEVYHEAHVYGYVHVCDDAHIASKARVSDVGIINGTQTIVNDMVNIRNFNDINSIKHEMILFSLGVLHITVDDNNVVFADNLLNIEYRMPIDKFIIKDEQLYTIFDTLMEKNPRFNEIDNVLEDIFNLIIESINQRKK